MARDVSSFSDHPRLIWDQSDIQRLFESLDQWTAFELPPGELSIAFLDDNALANIHRAFLDDPTPTDVITFPAEPEDDMAGEICVSVDMAERAAREHQQPFQHELTLYLVHGWLHLAGLDDQNQDDRETMRQAESQAMTWIKSQNALPDFDLQN